MTRLVFLVAMASPVAACAAGALELPRGEGAGVPVPHERLARLARDCQTGTMRAEMALSGRVAGRRIRARLLAGLAEPDALRLEGVAPFGAPTFILVSRAGTAMLLLPRDRRVLAGEAPEAILEALAGVRIAPDDLRAILGGCGSRSLGAVAARAYGTSWTAVTLHDKVTIYLRTSRGAERIVAATRAVHGATPGMLAVEYGDFTGGRPARVRLRSSAPGVDADVQLVLSQVDINVPLDPSVFAVDVPAGAVPMSIDELREAGPLGGSRAR